VPPLVTPGLRAVRENFPRKGGLSIKTFTPLACPESWGEHEPRKIPALFQ
jgi:hypothetical protein